MSQRNPLNERYTAEGKKGQTRKSAAKAKPKSKAASSVRIQNIEPTKQEKKARQKEQRQKDQALEREAYTVPTPQYKKLRRIWFALLGAGVVLLLISVFLQFQFPELTVPAMVLIGLAYATVIGAFVFDRVKIGKLRKAYKAELAKTKSKDARAQEKAAKAEEIKKRAEEAAMTPEEREAARLAAAPKSWAERAVGAVKGVKDQAFAKKEDTETNDASDNEEDIEGKSSQDDSGATKATIVEAADEDTKETTQASSVKG